MVDLAQDEVELVEKGAAADGYQWREMNMPYG